jgi:hypothetical protein
VLLVAQDLRGIENSRMDSEELRNRIRAFLQQKLDETRAQDPAHIGAQVHLAEIEKEFPELPPEEADDLTLDVLEVLQQHFVIVDGPHYPSRVNWIVWFTDEEGERRLQSLS